MTGKNARDLKGALILLAIVFAFMNLPITIVLLVLWFLLNIIF